MNDLQDAIKKNPPDIKLLQLLLQGSISTQVCYKNHPWIFSMSTIGMSTCRDQN